MNIAPRLRRKLGVSWLQFVEEVAYFSIMPRTFAVFGAFAAVAVILRAFRWTPDQPEVAWLIVASSSGVLAIGAALGMIVRVRVPRRRLWMWALALWLSMAILRNFLELSLAQLTQQGSLRSIALTPLVIIVTTLMWVALIAGLQALNSLQRSTSEELDVWIARLQDQTARRWIEIDDERSRLAALVQRRITPVLNDLIAVFTARGGADRAEGFTSLAAQVAEDARSLVREASHDMEELAQRSAELAEQVVVGPELVPAARTRTRTPVVTTQAVRVEPWSAFVALPALGLAAPAPILATFVRLVLAALIGYACLAAVARILRRNQRPSSLSPLVLVAMGNTLGVAGGVYISGFISQRLFVATSASPWFTPVTTAALDVTVVLLAAVVTTAISLNVADRRIWLLSMNELEATRDQLDVLDSDMRRQYERMAAQTSSMLHGPIQGRLAAIGMTLRFEGDDISESVLDSLKSLLLECEVDLKRASTDPREDQASTWNVLYSLRMQWAGLMSVTWSVDAAATAEINADPALLRNLETLVAELANNASRHGGARELDIAIAVSPRQVLVTARDNGSGPNSPVQPAPAMDAPVGRGLSISMDRDGWCSVSAAIPRGV